MKERKRERILCLKCRNHSSYTSPDLGAISRTRKNDTPWIFNVPAYQEFRIHSGRAHFN